MNHRRIGCVMLMMMVFNIGIAQVEDSVLVSKNDSHVLIGTTVLRGSEKNMSAAFIHGLLLTDLKSSECLSRDFENLPPEEIMTVRHMNDTLLVIEINTTANCSHNFLGEIEVVEDSIINLSKITYGNYAMCDCCFGLTYSIRILEDQNFDAGKIRLVMIDENKKTLKKISWRNK